MKLRVGITLGDPAGIGPEIVDAALRSGRIPADVEYRVIGKSDGFKAGTPTDDSARAAFAALEESVRLIKAGEIHAVVTAPVAKANMYRIGFTFPGQTEFFAARSDVENFAMLLTAGTITVALVTMHIPLRDVAAATRRPEIVRIGKLLYDFLLLRGRSLTALSGQSATRGAKESEVRPRIAVAGLNPHAGESGAIGREEIEIIAPAIAELNAALGARHSPLPFSGPHSPDTLFAHLARGAWDAALCMYHDQGLIPLKLHGFDQGVNVTLGLPFPRTSPDHGTAFDIAGQKVARPDSMIAAINLAVELARTQRESRQ